MKTKSILILSIIVILCSCSHFGGGKIIQNRDVEYISAQTSPPLRIPPGLSSSTISAHYPVSERRYEGPVEVNLSPPGLDNSAK